MKVLYSAGTPMTLGNTAAAQVVRLLVLRRDCQHQVEPDPAAQGARYGADLPVIDSGLTPPPPGEASDTGGAGSTTGTATAIGAPVVKEAEKVPVLSVPGRISLLLDLGLG